MEYLQTTDHYKIRRWAERYNGKPQIIDDPEVSSDIPGIRIDFPREIDDILLPGRKKVRNVSWEEFFREFEDLHLVFLYTDRVDIHNPASIFNAYRFIKRNDV